MSLYTTLMKQGFTEKEASHISTQMANRFGEQFIDLAPAWVMHELDHKLVNNLKEDDRKIYLLEAHEEKYFDGSIRVPYCVLMYDMDNLRGAA